MPSAEYLYETIQAETKMWGDLLLATGGCLKPEKCFWYMLDYECCEGEWSPREVVNWELMIPMDDGTKKPRIAPLEEVLSSSSASRPK